MEAPDRLEQDMNHARTASLTALRGSEDIELPNKAELLYCAGASAPLDERPNLRKQSAQRKWASRWRLRWRWRLRVLKVGEIDDFDNLRAKAVSGP